MDVLARVWDDLAGRIHGPMTFRFFLQPLMAAIYAIRDGIGDARRGEPAYFWSMFFDSGGRRARIRSGWNSIARVFFLGVAMDLIYQLIELRWIYPLEALIVAVGLAILPYVLLRGPAKRLAERWLRMANQEWKRPTS